MQLEYHISDTEHPETLLFVHGAGANADQFRNQYEFFAEYYQVVSISLPGHGNSPKPVKNITEQYALELLADDVLEFINDRKLKNIHYIGNSAGGVLGYIVVTKSPGLFLSLTTFGTTGQLNLPKFVAPLVRGLDSFMLRFFQKKYLKFVANYTGLNDDSRQMVYQMFLKATGAIPHIRYHLARYNYLEYIANLPVRYTLIQCEHDKDINKALKTTLEAMAVNPTAKLVTLPEAGHLANLDNPGAFNELLLSVLKSGVDGT
ncbi:alpha/beta hydrolase [Cytophagaceae bacterium ABcell3]|nr:alpha/beta hydrolase [Cytophagaceae bacterium ABcell3]